MIETFIVEYIRLLTLSEAVPPFQNNIVRLIESHGVFINTIGCQCIEYIGDGHHTRRKKYRQKCVEPKRTVGG